MKKTLLALSVPLFALSGFITRVQAQTLSISPTLTFSNGTGFGDHIAQDGDGGSTAISDFTIQIMPINSSGVLLTTDPLEYHNGSEISWSGYPSIITYGGALSLYGWSIKSDNGNNFSLLSASVLDYGDFSGGTFMAEAFNNGVSLGTASIAANTTSTMSQFTYPGSLPTIFRNVDEVRIYKQGGDSWLAVNNIKVSTSVALPLTWLNFTATQKNKATELKWSTATEQNTRDFLVQHSTNGRNWGAIGTVAAAGNSSTVQQYSFVHASPMNGLNYYRLLQHDLDGKESYSRIVTLDLHGSSQILSVYPNPVANGQLTVKLEKDARVELLNAAGVLVFQKQLQVGVHQLALSSLAKGLYWIRAGAQTATFVLQ